MQILLVSCEQLLRGRDQVVSLPCPDSDIVSLIRCRQSDDRAKCNKLMRRNPAIAFYLFRAYFAANGTPPTDLGCLLEFGCSDLPLIRLGDNNRSFQLKTKIRQSVRRWVLAKSHDSLIKAMRQFLSGSLKQKFNAADRPSRESLDRVAGPVVSLLYEQVNARPTTEKRRRKVNRVCKLWEPTSGLPMSSADVLLRELAAVTTSNGTLQKEFETAKLESLRQLAYGASHEINNPLANVATRAQTLIAAETCPEKSSRLATIYQQAMRAHEMISDMMLFARPPAVSISNVDLRLLTKRIVDSLADQLSHRKVQLIVRLGASIDRAQLDADQFCIMLGCLVENSANAMEGEGGEIDLQFERTQDRLIIKVTDNGTGIDAAIVPHLFDPFFSGREAGRGLGFGLSKAWTIARQHGGTIWYDTTSEPDCTRFVVDLPVDSMAG